MSNFKYFGTIQQMHSYHSVKDILFSRWLSKNTQNYNCTCCLVRVRKLVSQIEGDEIGSAFSATKYWFRYFGQDWEVSRAVEWKRSILKRIMPCTARKLLLGRSNKLAWDWRRMWHVWERKDIYTHSLLWRNLKATPLERQSCSWDDKYWNGP